MFDGNAAVSTLADFKGRKVCFVDPGSTSGFLYPTAGLIESKVIASGSEADLSASVQPVCAGGHDASALAIAAGDCDAGFAFDTMVDKTLVEKGDLKPGQLKAVWKSEIIAGSLFAVNNELGTEVVDKLKTRGFRPRDAPLVNTLGGAVGWSVPGVANRSDGLDLNELVVVAEDGHTEQCARNIVVSESISHDLPGGDKICLRRRRHEDAGADHILERGTCLVEGDPHVFDGFGGLACVIADRGGCAVGVQRAGAGEEDQA